MPPGRQGMFLNNFIKIQSKSDANSKSTFRDFTNHQNLKILRKIFLTFFYQISCSRGVSKNVTLFAYFQFSIVSTQSVPDIFLLSNQSPLSNITGMSLSYRFFAYFCIALKCCINFFMTKHFLYHLNWCALINHICSYCTPKNMRCNSNTI